MLVKKLSTLVFPMIGAILSWVALWPAVFIAFMSGISSGEPIGGFRGSVAIYSFFAVCVLAVALQLRGLYSIYNDDWKKKSWRLVFSPIWLSPVSIVITVLIAFALDL
ncbi:MAG: hypothetical protein ACTHOO_10345 [Alcanivorax sp.]